MIEADGPVAGLAGIERQLHFGRADAASDIAGLVGILPGELFRGPFRNFRRRLVHFVSQIAQLEFRQRNRVGVEGIGLDNVRAGFEILAVDALDHLRLREHQNVVGVLEIDRVVLKPLAAVVGLLGFLIHNQRPHRAVNDKNAFGEELFDIRFGHVLRLG